MTRSHVSSMGGVICNIASAKNALLTGIKRAVAHKRLILSVFAIAAAFGCNTAKAQTWTGSSPSEANNKTVYLYNVGAKKFLGKGGRWGTEANLNYEGVPFILTYSSKTFTLQSLVKAQGDKTSASGYLQIMDGTQTTSTHDNGNYFVDRLTGSSFTATSITTTDNKTAYTLKATTAGTSKTYYMVGTEDGTVGSLETVTDEAYNQWMIVTEAERRKAFESAEAANAKPVNATFLMYDFDFARNDNTVSYWKTGTSSTLSNYSSALRLPSYAQGGTVKTYTHTYTSKHDAEYKNGSTVYENETSHTQTFTITTLVPGDKMPQAITAFCGGATKTVTSGRKSTTYTHTSEEVTFTLTSTSETESTPTAYTYYVGNGYYDGDGSDGINTITYTTTDASSNSVEYKFDGITGQLHDAEKNRQATYGGNWTANIHGASGAVQQTLSSDNMVRKGYYRVSCKAFTTSTTGTVRLWAASGSNGDGTSETTSEKYAYTAIPTIDEAPATYVAASQTLEAGGQTYDVSVKVYAESTSDLLKFGIYVNDADETAWTCFDDFAIEYLGDPSTVLVLDEDQTSGNYIKNQATNDDDELKTVKLYLHRTMNANTWNSLVLPVSLTVGHVKSAFGDQVRISAFEGATDENHKNRIIFKAISASRDNNDEVAIEKEKLYLVKPTKAMPTEQTAVEFEVPGQTEKAKITDYYTIVGVTYAKAADVNDIDYSLKVEGGKGKETYEGEEDAIQFVGTYVKLGDDNKIPTNSYVLNGNNVGGTAGLWYFRTDETPSKGFRGWLQPTTAEAPTEYEINGVVEKVNGKVNGIAAIDADAKTIGGNVYNLNGQLVRRNAASLDGLAHGVYVVNGKKVVVK